MKLILSLCRYQKRVSNIIDDVLEWSPRLALSGMMDKQQNVVNATGSVDGSSQTSKTSPDHAASPDGDAAKTFDEQYGTEEVIVGNVEDAGEDKQND